MSRTHSRRHVGDSLPDEAFKFGPPLPTTSNDLWSQDHHFGQSIAKKAATVQRRNTSYGHHVTAARPSDRTRVCAILERLEAQYLVLHANGKKSWLNRQAISDGKMRTMFDAEYRGIGLEVDIVPGHSHSRTLLVHFHGRPDGEIFRVQKHALSTTLQTSLKAGESCAVATAAHSPSPKASLVVRKRKIRSSAATGPKVRAASTPHMDTPIIAACEKKERPADC
ncbi:hypothetical protein PWT90_02206 [Aphanocladium album]|nr:hypothetical protein PWT90_02206 [Aphanocladium album]